MGRSQDRPFSAAEDAVAELPAPSRRPDSVEVWPTLFGHAPSFELRQAMEARHRLGIERYGQPLVTHDGRAFGVDLLQELLDAAVYAQKIHLEFGGAGPCSMAQRLLSDAERVRLSRGGR